MSQSHPSVFPVESSFPFPTYLRQFEEPSSATSFTPSAVSTSFPNIFGYFTHSNTSSLATDSPDPLSSHLSEPLLYGLDSLSLNPISPLAPPAGSFGKDNLTSTVILPSINYHVTENDTYPLFLVPQQVENTRNSQGVTVRSVDSKGKTRSTSSVTASQISRPNSSKLARNRFHPTWCAPCQKTYDRKDAYIRHTRTNKHIRNAAMLEESNASFSNSSFTPSPTDSPSPLPSPSCQVGLRPFDDWPVPPSISEASTTYNTLATIPPVYNGTSNKVGDMFDSYTSSNSSFTRNNILDDGQMPILGDTGTYSCHQTLHPMNMPREIYHFMGTTFIHGPSVDNTTFGHDMNFGGVYAF